jgi:hypothetical protein
MSAEIVNLDEARIIRDIMEDALRDGVPGWRDLQVSEQWQASLSK